MESKNTNLPLSSKVANPRIYKKLHVNKILKICAIITLNRFFVMSTFPGSWDGYLGYLRSNQDSISMDMAM